MNDRLKYLASLLSDVENGKLSAIVAADMAGLIQPYEDSLGEKAALFRLQWEVENLK
jgi:hypothetical protein